MVDSTTTDQFPRELAHRSNHGIEVSLLWNTRTNQLIVFVSDEKAGDSFSMEVESNHALDAFDQPYAYAASRGIGYRTERPEAVYT